MKYLSIILVIVWVFLGGANAFAEESAPEEEISAEDIQRAQEYFDLGAQLYFEGQYSRAAVEFRRAHEIYPHPLFLYNIALIQRRLGLPEEALALARRAQAMEESLPADEDAQNQAMISGISSALVGREIVAKLAGVDIEELPTGVDSPGAVDSQPILSPLGWAGVGALSLGVVGLTGGGIIQSRLSDNQAVYELREPINPESQVVAQLGETIESQKRQRTFLFISGASLAAVGTALIVMELLPKEGESDLALSISIAHPGVEVIYRW